MMTKSWRAKWNTSAPIAAIRPKFDMADFDFEEDYICPQCHKSFFPETDDEDTEPDEETR